MRHTRRSSRTAVALALTLAVAGLAPTVAGATVFRATTWNMASGADAYTNAAHYNNAPVVLVGYLQGHPSWEVSTQETCRKQSDVVAFSMNSQGAGYTYYFGTDSSGEQRCWPFGGGNAWSNGFGNSVMAIGSYVGPNFYAFPPPATAPNQNISCITMLNIGFATLNCSLHYTAYSEAAATSQMAQARVATTSWSNSTGAWGIISGDHNISYQAGFNNSEFPNWWNVFDEASLLTYRPTHNYTRMIDYLWARRPKFTLSSRGGCTPEYTYSDHEICPGLFAVG